VKKIAASQLLYHVGGSTVAGLAQVFWSGWADLLDNGEAAAAAVAFLLEFRAAGCYEDRGGEGWREQLLLLVNSWTGCSW